MSERREIYLGSWFQWVWCWPAGSVAVGGTILQWQENKKGVASCSLCGSQEVEKQVREETGQDILLKVTPQ